MKFSELHFSSNPRSEYNDSLQAVGITQNGKMFSVMQTAYDIQGRPRITYDVCWIGRDDLDTDRWLSPDDVERVLNVGPPDVENAPGDELEPSE